MFEACLTQALKRLCRGVTLHGFVGVFVLWPRLVRFQEPMAVFNQETRKGWPVARRGFLVQQEEVPGMRRWAEQCDAHQRQVRTHAIQVFAVGVEQLFFAEEIVRGAFLLLVFSRVRSLATACILTMQAKGRELCSCLIHVKKTKRIPIAG